MADTALSAITRKLTSFASTLRFYASDGDDAYVEASDLLSLTGAVTCNQTRVTSIAAGAVGNSHLATNAVAQSNMQDASVGTAELVDASVTEAKLATDSVSNLKIAGNAVTAGKISSDAVTTTKILDAAVTTAKIADANVTKAKLAGDALRGTVNAQTGTTYTLQTSDAQNNVTFDNAATITVTIPSATFTAGDEVDCFQIGAGQVQFSAGAGMTIYSPETNNLEKQYCGCTVKFLTASIAILAGQLELSP